MKQFLQQQTLPIYNILRNCFYNNKHTQTTKFYETVFITTNTPKLQNSMKLFL